MFQEIKTVCSPCRCYDFIQLRNSFLISVLIPDEEKEGKRWNCCKTNAQVGLSKMTRK